MNVVKIEIDPMEVTIHREQYKGLCTAEKIIRKHMNDGWIPVEERLPEDDSMVLVTCQTKKGIRSVNRAYYDGAFWHGSGSMSGVIAWQPLPEPYRLEPLETRKELNKDLERDTRDSEWKRNFMKRFERRC